MIDQEQINELWSIRSDNYNAYVREELSTERPEAWLALIEGNAPPGRPLRILDAGCGPGFFSVLLAAAGHDVTGIDGSARMLAHAKENAAACGVSPVLLREHDLEDAPLFLFRAENDGADQGRGVFPRLLSICENNHAIRKSFCPFGFRQV